MRALAWNGCKVTGASPVFARGFVVPPSPFHPAQVAPARPFFQETGRLCPNVQSSTESVQRAFPNAAKQPPSPAGN